MMALGTFLLFAPLLIVSANQALIYDADCNDANIFKAVDVALKSYNAENVYGNLFILHRITDARIQPESDGVLRNFVDYEIREGACNVKSGKDWKECNLFSTKLAVKKCSAHVLLNRQLNTSEIIFQSCSGPIHASVTGEAVGSLKSADPNDTVVLEMVQLSIDRMNKLGNHPFHFSLEKVLNAWRQVVSGWNFQINYTIRQTNCSKRHFKNASSEECSFDINGQSGKCSSQVHWTLQGQFDITEMTCTSDSGVCLNCPNAIENNDPELLNLLMQFIDEYNVNNSHPALYKISKVVTATEEGSHPKQYEVEFEMKETNCSKAEYAILGEECDFIDSQTFFECEVKMIVTKETVAHSHVCFETKNASI
ncbi:kininogen-1 [Pelobates fuscus]|uniref:kininogen-1 n=1 Tax=Pelobates fuscus TaxID=191477 RepID=UPI002FE49F65